MSKNVVYGDVKVDIEGLSSRVGSNAEDINKILEIGDEIYRTVKRRTAKEDTDKLLKKLQDKYKDFSTSFPIVLRWIVQTGEYSTEIFKKFLQTQVKSMYKDRKEFTRMQAEYIVMMYKHKNPKITGKLVQKYREAINKKLNEEDAKFQAAKTEADELVKKIDKDADTERRQLLLNFIRQKQQVKNKELS